MGWWMHTRISQRLAMFHYPLERWGEAGQAPGGVPGRGGSGEESSAWDGHCRAALPRTGARFARARRLAGASSCRTQKPGASKCGVAARGHMQVWLLPFLHGWNQAPSRCPVISW